MVRNATLPHERQQLDSGRIIAISAAIVANIALVAVLVRPMEYTVPVDPPDKSIQVQFVPPKQKPLAPVILHVLKRPVPPPHLPQPIRQPKLPPVVLEHPNIVSTQADPKPLTDLNPQPTPPPVPTKPVETSLTPTAAPAPSYPRDALREGISGTVQLELLVGVDGRVLEVKIMHSSGNHLLDEAAREQVLRNWRFQPALRDGIPVQSLGIVPIVFDLDAR
jgi:periplasmic protein TonB